MVSFTDHPTEWERLDWQLLRNSPVTLYFKREILKADVSWFQAQGYRVCSLDAGDVSGPEALLVALGELLSFPDYFGRNLDAFNDCLGDVDISELGGLVLVLDDFGSFASAFPREPQAILDISAHQSRSFMLTGRRFLVLAQSDDPDATFDPVGACPVTWNPQEWPSAKRGL
jgi:RNAse (barnase) inhibitor barstar